MAVRWVILRGQQIYTGMALFHCMVWHGTLRFITDHFRVVFHWVPYQIPGTFLVPPRPRFQAIRTVTKTWRVNSTDHWLAGENRHYCVTELATRDPTYTRLIYISTASEGSNTTFVWTNSPFCINQNIAVSLCVEEVQTFLSLIAEERIQRQLDGAMPKEKALCIYFCTLYIKYLYVKKIFFCLYFYLCICFASIKNNLIE